MGSLIFNAEDVREVYKHAKSCRRWAKSETGRKPAFPCLLLVHDHGVYLMSGGLPRVIPDASAKRMRCVYAADCHPTRDREWWSASVELVGGDDFVEYLPLSMFTGLFALPGLSKLIIEVTQAELNITAIIKEPKGRAVPDRPRHKPHAVRELGL